MSLSVWVLFNSVAFSGICSQLLKLLELSLEQLVELGAGSWNERETWQAGVVRSSQEQRLLIQC